MGDREDPFLAGLLETPSPCCDREGLSPGLSPSVLLALGQGLPVCGAWGRASSSELELFDAAVICFFWPSQWCEGLGPSVLLALGEGPSCVWCLEQGIFLGA